MSATLDRYRILRQGSDLSDESLILELGDRVVNEGKKQLFDTDPEFYEEYQSLRRERRDSPWETGLTAIGSGIADFLPKTLYQVGELAARSNKLVYPIDAFSDLGDWFAKKAAQEEQEAAARRDPYGVQSFRDIEGPSDFLNYAARIGGENLPSMAIPMGLGVGVGARAARLAAAEGLEALAARTAARAAAEKSSFIANAVQNTADIYGGLDEEAKESGTGILSAIGGGALAGKLENIGQLPIMDKLFPAVERKFVPTMVKDVLARGGVWGSLSNMAASGISEGLTEGLQEGVAIAAEEFNNKRQLSASAIKDRIAEAMVGGGVLGAGFGAASGFINTQPPSNEKEESEEGYKPKTLALPPPPEQLALPGPAGTPDPNFIMGEGGEPQPGVTRPARPAPRQLGDSSTNFVLGEGSPVQLGASRPTRQTLALPPATPAYQQTLDTKGAVSLVADHEEIPVAKVVTPVEVNEAADAVTARNAPVVAPPAPPPVLAPEGEAPAPAPVKPSVPPSTGDKPPLSTLLAKYLTGPVERSREEVRTAFLKEATEAGHSSKVAEKVFLAHFPDNSVPSLVTVKPDEPVFSGIPAPIRGYMFTPEDGNNFTRMEIAADGGNAGKLTRKAVFIEDTQTGKVHLRTVRRNSQALPGKPGKGLRVGRSQRIAKEHERTGKNNRTTDFNVTGKETAEWDKMEQRGDGRYRVLGYLEWDAGKGVNEKDLSINFDSVDDVRNNRELAQYFDAFYKDRATLSPEMQARLAAADNVKGTKRTVQSGSVQLFEERTADETDVGGEDVTEETETNIDEDAGGGEATIVEEDTSVDIPASDEESAGGPARGVPVGEEETEEIADEGESPRAMSARKMADHVVWLKGILAALNKLEDGETLSDADIAAFTDEGVAVTGNSRANTKAIVEEMSDVESIPAVESLIKSFSPGSPTVQELTLRTAASFTITLPVAQSKFYDFITSLKLAGVNVAFLADSLLKRVTNEGKARGVSLTDRDGRAFVGLSGNYMKGEITSDDVMALFHEGAHPFLRGLPEWTQRLYHQAISGLPWQSQAWISTGLGQDPRLIANTPYEQLTEPQKRIYDSITPEEMVKLRAVDPTTLAIERAVDHLAAFGISRTESRSLLSQIIRYIKGALLGVALELQKAIKGPNNVNPALARAYVENLFLQFINRDFAQSNGALAVSLRQWIGGEPTPTEKLDVFENVDGADQHFQYDPATGTKTPILPVTNTTEGQTLSMQEIIDHKNLDSRIKALTMRQIPMDVIPYLTGGIPWDKMTTEQQVGLAEEADRQLAAVELKRNAEGQLLAPNGQVSKLRESHWRIVRTPLFQRWFGDWMNDPAKASKVIDPETGEPRVVWHGTNKDFDTFKITADYGFHFGELMEAIKRVEGNNVRFTRGYFGETLTPPPGESWQEATYTTDFNGDKAHYNAVGVNFVPAFLNIRTPIKMTDGFWGDAKNIVELRNAGAIDEATADRAFAEKTLVGSVEIIKQALLDKGFDGAMYDNVAETNDTGTQTYIAFKPENVKTVTNRVFTPTERMQYTQRTAQDIQPTVSANTQFAVNNFLRTMIANLLMQPDIQRTISPRYLRNGQDTAEHLIFGRGEENTFSKKIQALKTQFTNAVDVVTKQPFPFDETARINDLAGGAKGSAQRQAVSSALIDAQKMETHVVREIGFMTKRKAELDKKVEKGNELTDAEEILLANLNSDILLFNRILNTPDVGLTAQVERLRGKLGTGFVFVMTEGAEYTVPPTPNAKASDMQKGTVPKGFMFSQAESEKMQKAIAKQKAWLLNEDNKKQGDLYDTILNQNRRMSEAAFYTVYSDQKRRLQKSAYDAMSNMLRGIGTPSAKALASRVYLLEAVLAEYIKPMDILGGKWSTAYTNAYKALKFDGTYDEFRQRYYNPLMLILMDIPDGTTDPLNRAISVFNALRPAKYKITGDGATAMRELARQSIAIDEELARIFEKEGLKVSDKALGSVGEGDREQARVRGLIRQGIFTGRVSPTESLALLIAKMNQTWQQTTDGPTMAKNAFDSWKISRAKFTENFEPFFSNETKRHFVEPLVYHNIPLFESPKTMSAGVTIYASHSNVRQAWETAKAASTGNEADLATFISELNRLEGGTAATEADVAGMTIAALAKMHSKADNLFNQRAKKADEGVHVIPKQMMESRDANDFPPEWVDVDLFDRGSNKGVIHSFAMNKAFGASGLSGTEFMVNYQALMHELAGMDEEYREYRKVMGLSAKQTKARMDADLPGDTRGSRKGRYEIARDAANHIQMLTGLRKNIAKLNDPHATHSGDARLGEELTGVAATFTLQGLRQAISQITEMFSPLWKYKFSPTGLKAVLNAVRGTGAEVVSSTLELIGAKHHFMAELARRTNRVGGVDPANFLNAQDMMNDFGTNNALASDDPLDRRTSRVTKWLTDKLRFTRSIADLQPADVAAAAVNKASRGKLDVNLSGLQGEQALAAKFRLFGMFNSINLWMLNGATISQYYTFKDMVMRGIEYINSSGNPAEFARKLIEGEMQLEGNDLGYNRKFLVLNDEAAWDFMKEAVGNKMALGSIEHMIADAWYRTRNNPQAPIITDEQYSRIRSLVVSEFQLSSTLTNTPLEARTNGIMKPFMTFITWPYSAMMRFPTLFQNAQNQYTATAITDGTIALMAGIIPLTMAASFAVDWSDEELLGKKQNIRDADVETLIPGVAPFIDPAATMERLARYGTAGLLSEVANGIINGDDTRGGGSFDSRIFILSQFQSIKQIASTLRHTGKMDYQSFFRPLMQVMGGNSVLQYSQMFNKMTGANNVESAFNERVSVGNYLRATGRDLKLQVIPSKSSGQGIPGKHTPYVARMELAVYQDNLGQFKDSFSKAVSAYAEEHPDEEDPQARVIASFKARHPLKRVFRVQPTEREYRSILENLNSHGSEAVSSSVQLFNKYLLKLGAKPTTGKKEKPGPKLKSLNLNLGLSSLNAANAAYASSFLD